MTTSSTAAGSPAQTPFAIDSARMELANSQVVALNRILYDIAHELQVILDRTSLAEINERGSSRDGSTPKPKPIKFVFSQVQRQQVPPGSITVTPIAMEFNRSKDAWAQAAVLNWDERKLEDIENYVSHSIPRDTLLPGFLINALEDPARELDSAVKCIIAVGDSSDADVRSQKWLQVIQMYGEDNTDEAPNHGGPVGKNPPRKHRQVVKAQSRPPEMTDEAMDDLLKNSKHWLYYANSLYLDQLREIDPYCQRFVVIVPIYDARPYGRELGSLQGCLLLNIGLNEYSGPTNPMTPPEPLTDVQRKAYTHAAKEVASRLVGKLSRSTELLMVESQKAAMAKVVAEMPRLHFDAVQHFLLTLRHAQYWSRVDVYRDEEYVYSFEWENVNDRGKVTRIWSHTVTGPGCITLRPDRTRLFAPFGIPSCLCRSENQFIGNVDTEKIDPTDRLFTEALDGDEVAAFHGIKLVFQFSEIAVLPGPNDFARRAFCRSLAQQQLEVLRAVLPIVRARKSALRSAISAIMGRNMSHNIGSHVVARYASEVSLDYTQKHKDGDCHRTDFLSYLQRRMDFLAEIATSDRAFWSQPLSLREQIQRLDFDIQKGRFENPEVDSAGVFPREPILLTFISGKKSIKATVKYAPAADYLFSCPGGEVGVHALFVILENIIRNSARHGGESDEPVELLVDVSTNWWNESLIGLEIIDRRTRLHSDGRRLSDDTPEDKIKAENEAIELADTGRKSLFDSDLRRRTLISVPEDINSILQDEGILDTSGAPNPSYWGLREMQICAHYLRGFPLSGIESSGKPSAVLEAGIHSLGDREHCLMYRLKIETAKLVAILHVNEEITEESALKLRERGVLALPAPKQDDDALWWKAARQVQNYSVLVEESGLVWPERIPEVTLPVRRVTLESSRIVEMLSWSGETEAKAGTNPPWLEALHREFAHRGRDQRKAWKGRAIFGVAVAGNIALKPESLRLRSYPGGDGLFFVHRNEGSAISPLPEDTKIVSWHNRLAATPNMDGIVSAAWIDHSVITDFDTNCARLGHAAQNPAGQARNPGLANRLWISAEGAFTASVHSAYIGSCDSCEGWELLAAAVPRVIVLDERVQSEIGRNARANLTNGTLWPLMGVWVPQRSSRPDQEWPVASDLDSPNFDTIRTFLQRPAIRDDQYPVDFLVIHLTILEKLCDQVGAKPSKTPEALRATLIKLTENTPASSAKIVIVTGRGVPNMARRVNDLGVRYLPVSALLEYLVLRPSKLGLMRVLWSASGPTFEFKQKVE